MQLSVVTTSFNSANYIEKFLENITNNIKEANFTNYEIIIIDDGSSDDTLEKLNNIKKKNNQITITQLSKNYGHHKALITGLNQASGELVFVIDSDLEEDPSNLIVFLKDIEQNDIVYGVRKKRHAGVFSNFFGQSFYKLFNLISTSEIPENLATITLMKKNVCDELCKFGENEIFFHGVLHTVGFKKKEIQIEKKYKGNTNYNVTRKINLFFDAVTSFSSVPLKFFFYTGLIISSFSSLYAIFLFIKYFLNKISVPGFTTVTVLILFFGGFIMMGIGVVGIYIHKIFLEVKKRPRVTIKKKF